MKNYLNMLNDSIKYNIILSVKCFQYIVMCECGGQRALDVAMYFIKAMLYTHSAQVIHLTLSITTTAFSHSLYKEWTILIPVSLQQCAREALRAEVKLLSSCCSQHVDLFIGPQHPKLKVLLSALLICSTEPKSFQIKHINSCMCELLRPKCSLPRTLSLD